MRLVELVVAVFVVWVFTHSFATRAAGLALDPDTQTLVAGLVEECGRVSGHLN
jgi:hypothetical protein